MLRPERVEGERPSNNNNNNNNNNNRSNKAKSIAKGPLLFAVALFAATPICMAEVAFATSLTVTTGAGVFFSEAFTALRAFTRFVSDPINIKNTKADRKPTQNESRFTDTTIYITPFSRADRFIRVYPIRLSAASPATYPTTF